MDFIKVVGGGLIAVVLVLFGMNQYQSYKINKKANDAVEAIEKNIKISLDKDKEITKARTLIAAIQSSVVTERQKRILNGDFTEITDLSSGDGVFTNFNADKNGNSNVVLSYPPKDCEIEGIFSHCWKGSGMLYMYHTGGNIFMFTLF